MQLLSPGSRAIVRYDAIKFGFVVFKSKSINPERNEAKYFFLQKKALILPEILSMLKNLGWQTVMFG